MLTTSTVEQNTNYKPNIAFRNRMLDDLSFCGFTENQKKGLLFFTSICTACDSALEDNAQYALNQFSISTGKMKDYGEINDFVITKIIYTANHLIHQNILQGDNLDLYLREVQLPIANKIIIGKTELDESFVNNYSKNLVYQVGSLTNFYMYFFESIGEHLTEVNFDLEKSYCAGWAYFSKQCHFDVNGTTYMIKVLKECLPPLYEALTNYPKWITLYEEEFYASHLFSIIFQYYYMGLSPSVLEPVHTFHQFVFYESGTPKIREMWEEFDEDMFVNIILNAASIRNSEFYELRPNFLVFNDIAAPDLKNKSLSMDEFFTTIQSIVIKKYNLNVNYNINNRGEWMQFYAILFFQTCVHSMILSDLDFGEY